MADPWMVTCWNCSSEFDAATTPWCTHADSTKICPFCLHCFCHSPEDFKEKFWAGCPPPCMSEKEEIQERSYYKLGEVLIKAGKITSAQLETALHKQNIFKKKLGEILIMMSLISPEELQLYLLNQKSVESIDLSAVDIHPYLVRKIGLEFCRSNRIVPIENPTIAQKEALRFALVSIEDLNRIKKLPELKPYVLIPYIAKEEDILQKLEQMQNGLSKNLFPMEIQEEKFPDLLNQILKDAIIRSYPDVYFEFKENRIHVFYQDFFRLIPVSLPEMNHPKFFNKVKKIAGIDESPPSPSGVIKSTIRLSRNAEHMQIRVLYYPGRNQENLRLRLINTIHLQKPLQEKEWDIDEWNALRSQLQRRNGLFLIIGPNTARAQERLYSLMHTLEKETVVSIESIVLLRDSRFYQFERDEQEIPGNFYQTLLDYTPHSLFLFDFLDRHFDPKFLEFAEKGKLFLGIHAISYEEAFDRLVREQEIEFSYIQKNIQFILMDRQVQTLCPHCKVTDPHGAKARFPDVAFAENFPLFQEKGCEKCNQTGADQIQLVSELLAFDNDTQRRDFLPAELPSLSKWVSKYGFMTISQKILNRVLKGEVSYKEYSRFF